MADDQSPAPPTDPGDDLDRTPLERALIARRRGERNEPLDDELQRLVDDLAPWLDDLYDVAQAATDNDTGHGPGTDNSDVDSPGSGNDVPESLAPVSADDPVALMLGLVPDPQIAIDGRKLAAVRKKVGVDLKELVARLRHRGWPVQTKEALRWHTGTTVLAQALINAVAETLSVDSTAILARSSSAPPADDLLDDVRIASFLEQWASDIHMPPARLREQIAHLLIGANMRNSTSTSADTLLAVLTALRDVPDLLDDQ
jgi:hypothetical protein